MSVPSKVTGIRVVNPLTRWDLDIFWNANPEVDVVGYNVWRAAGPSLPNMEKITSVPISLLQLRDMSATQKINARYYYTVTAVNSLGEESEKADSVTFQMEARGPIKYILSEMVRRHNIALNNLVGEDVYYWVRKMFGVRCSCYDASHGQSMDPMCQNCYGTTWQGGYVPLGWVKVIIDPPSLLVRLGDSGWMMDGRSSVFVSTYPQLKNGDVIVRKDNRRYEIDSAEAFPWQGSVTAQKGKLQEIEPRLYNVFDIPTYL